MNENEAAANGHQSAPTRAKRRRPRASSRAIRPRSAITSGRQLFADGDPNSAWSRRYDDLLIAHIGDVSAGQGADFLSAAQEGLIRHATSIECELERLDAKLSRGEEIDLDSYARVSGHLRRMWETLGMARQQKPVNDMNSFLAKRKQKQKSIVTISPAPEPELINDAD